MAKCPYCGKSAGIFKKKHNDCEQKNTAGIAKIKQRLNSFFWDDKSTKTEILSLVESSFIPKSKLDELYENVYSDKIDEMLDDGLLSEDEETILEEFQDFYNIEQKVLDKNNAISKVVGASILRNMFEGKKITGRIKIIGDLPFKFMKSEELIYLYPKALFSEQRIKTEYEGESSGVSLRIVKGLYYRTSTFKGRPIRKAIMKDIAYGMMALTNKHLYFASSEKSFRIRYDRIISLDNYTDGIGIHKDGVTAKPMIFSEIDGWFCYNFIKNIENYNEFENN